MVVRYILRGAENKTRYVFADSKFERKKAEYFERGKSPRTFGEAAEI